MGLAQHHQITQQQQQLYQQQQQQQLYHQQQQQQQQRQQLYEQQQRAQQQAEAQAQQQAEARYQSQYHDQQQSLAVPAPSLPAPPAIIDTDTIIGGGDSRGGGALSMDVGEVEYPPVANPLEEDDDDAYAALEDMLEGPSDAAVRADDL
jgi:DNA mismatch repair ATPase MutL